MKMKKEVKATLLATLIVAMLAVIGVPLMAFIIVGVMSLLFGEAASGEVGVLCTLLLCLPYMWGMAELGNYLVKHFQEGFSRE